MKAKNKKNLILFGGSIILSIIIAYFSTGSFSVIPEILLNMLYGLTIGASLGFGCQIIANYFFRSEKPSTKPARTFVLVVILVATFIILDILVVNSIWFYFTQGISPIDLIQGSFGFRIMLLEFVIGMTIHLFLLSKNFSERLHANYIRIAEAEKKIEAYRYETLKSQIDPHFLFNTLNTLSGLIYTDVERADEFIQRFATIYRYVLEVQLLDVVPIEKELAFIKDYVHLNNIRFDNNIEMTVSIEDKDQYIVPMSLQLLVENAVKHNVISAENPLKIRIQEKDSTLSIENEIQLKKDPIPSHKLGINNLTVRYASLSKTAVQVHSTEKVFTVLLPKLKMD